MAFYLTEEQVALLRAVDRDSPTGYADIYDLIHFFVQSADPFGNAADDNVIAWFGAAKDANRGVGGASEFIRSYTAFQLEMRNGAPITGINSLIQNASNAIAQSVYDDLLGSDVIKDGVKYYELPTAMEIGAQDAAATVDALANYPGGVANWSGNPLFVGLGITDFWSNNILADDGDAYDLALSVGAMFHALGATSSTGFGDLFSLFFGQGIFDGTWAGLASSAAAAGATHSYLNRAYGDANLGIGDLVAGGLIFGSAANETLSADDTNNSLGWLHAGDGSDVILAATSASELVDDLGVFDGGEGDDSMSFNNTAITDAGGVTATLTEWISGVPFSATVTATYGGRDLDSTLFNIESLNLSDADDRLVVNSLTTTLNEVDALGSQDLGDTLDASELGSAFDFDLGTGAFVAGGSTLNLTSFENAIGSSGDDTISGSDGANILHGGLGADQLIGGGGDDFIFFDAADGANVDGGAGRDVVVALGSDGVTVDMTAQGLECVIGCDGADVITFGSGSGNLMAAGGAGSDTFYVSYGEGQDTRIIWASDDAESDDIIIYNSGEPGSQLGILVVTVTGLTRENFSSFDLSMLNLPTSFNWGAIDAVIINPDSRDNYYAGFDTSPMAVEFGGAISMDESLTPLEYETVADVTISQAVQGTSSALGADLHMQTEGSGWEYVEIWYREKGTTSTAWLNGGEWYDQGIEDTIEELTDEYGDPIAEWSIDMGGFQGGGDATGMSWFRDSQWTGGPNGWWFVAGGAMYGEDLVAAGAPHAIMPANQDPSPFDWLLAA